LKFIFRTSWTSSWRTSWASP